MKKTTFNKILYTFILVIVCSAAFSQNNNTDIVYLKDGSIIRGNIIEYITDGHVKIETIDNNIWVFKHNKIDKVVFKTLNKNKGTFIQKTGYYNLTDMGVLIGTGNNEKTAPFSINMINAYRFSPHFSAGLGAGVEFFSTPVIPLFIDARYEFYDGEFSPFVYLNGGYSFQVGENYDYYTDTNSKGGLMAGSGIGIRISLNNKSHLVVSMGYRFQQLTYSYYEEWTDDTIDRFEKLSRFAIRIGFMFN
ncbi:hypothetical protein ACFLSY_04580 [Bacteroidota bacterium]